jgi:hypothetical protein
LSGWQPIVLASPLGGAAKTKSSLLLKLKQLSDQNLEGQRLHKQAME